MTDADKSSPGRAGIIARTKPRFSFKAILLMGLIAVAGIAMLAKELGYYFYEGEGAGPAAPFELSVPPGLSVTRMALEGNRLAVHFAGPGGAESRFIDLLRMLPLTRSMDEPSIKKMAWAITVMTPFRGTTKNQLSVYTFATLQACEKSVPAVKRKHRLFFKAVDCVSLAPPGS